MATHNSERELMALARRTLGRPEHDRHPFPYIYFVALHDFVARYPNQTNFYIDLTDRGGMVSCMACLRDVPVGYLVKKGIYEFKDLRLWENHILSDTHKQKDAASEETLARSGSSLRQNGGGAAPQKAMLGGSGPILASHLSRTGENVRVPSLRSIKPPDYLNIEPLSSDIEEPISPTASIIEISSSSSDDLKGKGKASKRKQEYTFPDGEVIVIESSDDEDDIGNITVSQQTLMDTPVASGSRGALGVTHSYGNLGTLRPFPMKKNASNMSWTFRSSARDVSSASGYDTSASKAGPSRKRAHSIHDGNVEYITDEDTDGGSSAKKTRYDAESDLEALTDLDEDQEMSELNSWLPMPPYARGRADTLMPGGYTISSQEPSISTEDEDLHERFAAMPYTEFDKFNYFPFASGSNIPYPELGYSAPPIIGGAPVPTTTPIQRVGRTFNLNYDDESPITWLDQGGPNRAEQLQRFFDETMDDHEGAIPVRDAARALGLANTTDRLPKMEVPLMPHQLIGVSWMLKQELGRVQGGILADDMGLGKTMQTIALIVMNQPEESNERKSTLIVAPSALLDQWRQEIIDRTENDYFRIRVHHGKDKLRSVADVKKYDIIITTFQTLTNEFPANDDELKRRAKQQQQKKKKKGKNGDEAFIDDGSSDDKDRKRSSGMGPLAATKWYRVVIDEAQNIRNRATRSSRMMAMLNSEYRWALTGTPVTNTLADLYGLVRFLHYAPFNDWQEFNTKIARIQKAEPKKAGQRAQALLKKCLLRRTKQSKLDGKPLITLQPKTIDIEELEFSPEERQIYSAVEARQQQKLNRFIKAGTVMKNYSAVLVMLLRLRQVCNHPQLIAYAAGEFAADGAHIAQADNGDGELNSQAGSGSSANSKSKSMAKMVMGDVTFDLVMRQFRESVEEMCIAEVTGKTPPESEVVDCLICFEPHAGDCCVTSCGHVYCGDCLNDLFEAPLQGPAAGDDQYTADTRPCPKCRSKLNKAQIFSGSIFSLTDEEKDEIKRRVDKEYGRKFKTMHVDADEEDDFMTNKKGKGKAQAHTENEQDEEAKIGAELAKMGEGEGLVPGAKMIKMAQLVQQWHSEAPEDKIIAYSQWTSMIDLMQMLLERDNVESLRYDGQMNRVERDETLARFKKRDGPRILLISLKCGGVGLNLTEANRVICMDLAWNAATENQAIDRVHRMGQVKSVVVKRLIVKDTIEARILKLQADKQNLSDAALGEGSGAKMPRMNVAQLKTLFGMVGNGF